MAINPVRAYQQTLSSALAYYKSGIEDLVHNSNVVFNTVRDRGNYVSFDGPEIRHHLEIDKQAVQWATGYDYLANPPIERFNDAVFQPSTVYVPISFSGTELRANTGDRMIPLMRNYIKSATQDLVDGLEVAVNGNGTSFNGRDMIGFGAALPTVVNSGTYGGIPRSITEWQTTTWDADTDFPTIGTQVDSTTIRPMLSAIMAQRSRGNRAADLLIMSYEHWSALEQSMVAHQRIVNETRLGKLGFAAMEFIGGGKRAEVVLASGLNASMPANTTYGIESRSLYIYYRDELNFDKLFPGDGLMPINQDAIAQYIGWEGQMVLGNPLFSWRFYDSDPNS